MTGASLKKRGLEKISLKLLCLCWPPNDNNPGNYSNPLKQFIILIFKTKWKFINISVL